MAAYDSFMIPNSPKKAVQAEVEQNHILNLVPFSAVPKIIFENVKVGSSTCQEITLHNPTCKDIKVELIPKVPLCEHNLDLNSLNFEVAAGSEFTLRITWIPSSAGTTKITIPIRTNTKFRSDLQILGVAVAPVKNRKKILEAQNGETFSKPKSGVLPATRTLKQRSPERRKTFVLRSNKENFVVPQKSSRPEPAQRRLPPQKASRPEPARRGLPSAATVAHPSRFENLVISPFVSGQNRFKDVEMSPAVMNTSPALLRENLRRETYGISEGAALPTFVKRLEGFDEEREDTVGCCDRELDSFVGFSPGICSTAQKNPSDVDREVCLLVGKEESFGADGTEHLSSDTYVLDRLSTETYIKEELNERDSPMGDPKSCHRDLSGTILEVISEEGVSRPTATVLTISPPKPLKMLRNSGRMSPTLVTKRKITVIPNIKVFTPPEDQCVAKNGQPSVAPVPRVAMPRLTLSRSATLPRQSISRSIPKNASINSSKSASSINSSKSASSTNSSKSASSIIAPKTTSSINAPKTTSSINASKTASSQMSLFGARSSSRCSSVHSISSNSRASKLTSSARARPTAKSEFLYDPDALIAEMINNDLVAASTSADPFLTNTLFFDDSWKLKQERDMIKWLNVVLTPPAELAATVDVDIADVWQRCCRTEQIQLAPTREDLSADIYGATGQLAALRKAAISFLARTDIRQVLGKVTVHIDKKLLVVREDKDLHLDTGLKCQVMELLLSYNPLWLRIGLEAIYGRTVLLSSNSDVVGLAKFVLENVLSDANIIATHSHPTVPHLRLPTYADAMKKFILKKFFYLVYFLDRAKASKLIGHDPCLFMKSSKYKESREILTAFSCMFLSGVGDVIKHLALLGYHVSVKQQYIDEFEFAVTCLKDLRDGVRLVRAMEIILKNNTLMEKLRVPAISMLQKVHNMEVALNALSGAGYVITGNISPKDLVNGHYEKTLSLLWQIIYKFQAPRLEEAAKKIQAWWKNTGLHREIRSRIHARKRAMYALAATRIQASWRGWLARKRLAQLRQERAAELARREVAAVVIQKTWRMHIARKQLMRARQASNRIKEWFTGAMITRQLRDKFIVKRQAAIKIQSVFRGYLTRKRMANLRITAAALRIQTWFRRRRAAKLLEGVSTYVIAWIAERKIQTQACVTIQSRFRAQVEMRKQRNQYLALRNAAITIQRRFRVLLLMKSDRKSFLTFRHSVIVCQQMIRAQYAMREHRARYLAFKKAAITTQRRFRAQLAMRDARKDFLRKKSAAVRIQIWFRATLQMRHDRQEFLLKKQTVIIIEELYLGLLATRRERSSFVLKRASALVIQRKWRATLQMKAQKQVYTSLRSAAVTLQTLWRAQSEMKKARARFESWKHAAIVVQRRWRAIRAGREARREFLKVRNAAVVLQSRWRAKVEMERDRAAFLKIRSAAIVIQVYIKMFVARRSYQRLKNGMISIQMERAAKTIQAAWRGYATRKQLCATATEIHERCKNAAKEACVEKTLLYKSNHAVGCLRSGNLARALEALSALDRITKLSPELCISLANDGVVGDIYTFLSGLNRSESHRQILISGSSVLLNLTKFRQTASFVWQNGSRIFFFLHFMNIWLHKETAIFLNCATVLWHFSQYSEYKPVLKADRNVDTFLKIFSGKVLKKRWSVSANSHTLPSETPSWGLILKDGRPCIFSSEVFAVESLISAIAC